jgi:hypothetical protein
MKKQPLPRRIDESNPESYRHYKKWLASRAYNERCVLGSNSPVNLIQQTPYRNREAHNAKKRERMAALRAKQKLDLPIVQAARLAAKEESARKYRER